MTDRFLVRKGQHYTDWDAYRLNEIHRTVGESFDPMNWNQIHSWRVMAGLCTQHADTLAKAASALADHWPPQKSPAADQFLARVGDLIDRMRAAANAATENADAAAQVMTAHSDAYAKLTTIKRERDSLPVAVRGFSQLAYAEHDDDARAVMRTLDAAVADARERMVAPAPGVRNWDAEPPRPAHLNDPPGGSQGGSVVSAYSPAFPATQGWQPSRFTPSAAGAPIGAGADPVLDSGPKSSTFPGSPTPAFPGQYQTIEPPTPGGVGVGPGGLIGTTATTVGGGLPTASSPTTGTRGTTGTSRSAVGAHATAPPMTAGPMTGGGRASGANGVSPAGVPGNSYAARKQRTRDDGPWGVARGGPAVIQPGPEPEEHDPGPGVIGGAR